MIYDYEYNKEFAFIKTMLLNAAMQEIRKAMSIEPHESCRWIGKKYTDEKQRYCKWVEKLDKRKIKWGGK